MTLLGQFEDAAATGDLDIYDALTIAGMGATQTVIDGNGTDRVFDLTNAVSDTPVTLDGMRIQNGNPLMFNQEDGVALRTD